MEIHRLEFRYVLKLVRIGNVINYMLVQLPAVRVDEGNGKGADEDKRPGLQASEEFGTAGRNRLDQGIEQAVANVAGEDQEENEEATVQVRPKESHGHEPP